MNHSFFLDQLQSARDKFALEPEIVVWDGAIHQPIDSVKHTAHDGNRIVLCYGADVNWEERYDAIGVELEWAEKEIKNLQRTIQERDDELDEAAGEAENLKMEIAELESEKEDLESDLGVLKEKIKELEDKLNQK